MKEEKVFTRENGNKYLIQIDFHIKTWTAVEPVHVYRVSVSEKLKGKRKWNYHNENSIDNVTYEEIIEVKLLLWNKMKPV